MLKQMIKEKPNNFLEKTEVLLCPYEHQGTAV